MELQRRLTTSDHPVSTVLICHGYAEHQGRFTALADALLDAGFDVVSYDHAAHGTNPGPRARVDVGRLILDHVDVRRAALAHARTPDLFLFGHSMGGLVTAASTLLDPRHVRGTVLTGPAFRPLPAIPAGVATLMLPLARMVPGLPSAPRPRGVLSRDPAVEEAFEADPLNHHGAVPLLTGATMIVQGAHALRNAGMLRTPLLILHGTEDRLTDPRGSEEFVRRAREARPESDAHVRLVDGARHEVLNEPEGPALVRDITLWMKAH